MNFELTTEQNILQDSIRRFMRQRIAPIVMEYERRGEFPWDIIPELKQFGYLGGILPESEGGMGLTFMDYAILMEEAGYQWMSLRGTLNSINTAAYLLSNHGTKAQKNKYLGGILDGHLKFFMAITEPNHGSNVAGIETKAVDKGDHYVLNGSKLWITNAIWADFGVVVAKTYSQNCDGDISLFLVDPKVSKFKAERVKTMMVQATGTSALTFEDTIVPKENLLGMEGKGLASTLNGLTFGRLSVAMGAVGAAQAAFDLAVDYSKTRKQFGKPIASFQLVQKHIADICIRVEAARLLGYKAAAAMDAGSEARMECSIAKLYNTEAAHECASMAIQVHGGIGYSLDLPLERIFRDTRGSIIPEGTSEIQTLIMGREILGVSAFGAR